MYVKNVIRIGLRVIAVALIVYSSAMLVHAATALKRGKATFTEEVEALRPVRETTIESVAEPVIEVIEAEKVPLAAPDMAGDVEPEETEEVSQFQLDALREINPDIVGWLTVDGSGIDFPVLQDRAMHQTLENGESVEGDARRQELFYKYLYYDYLGRKSVMGSITVDVRNSGDLQDRYTLIYGHNTGNPGVMFSDLKNLTDETYFAEHRTAVLYTEQGAEELYLMAVAVVDGYSQEVFGRNDTMPGDAFDLDSALAVLSEHLLCGEIDAHTEQGCYVALSTCYVEGRPDDPARLVALYRAVD